MLVVLNTDILVYSANISGQISVNTIVGAATVFPFSRIRFANLAGVTFWNRNGNGLSYTIDSTTVQGFNPLFTRVDLLNAGFNGRFWGANSNESPENTGKVYFSNVIDYTSQATVLTTATIASNYIQINTKGKNIKAMVDQDNILYNFTTDAIFRIYNPQSGDNSPMSNVGAYSQESVAVHTDSIFFMGPAGIFELSGGAVTRISTPIDDILKSINVFADTSNGNFNTRCFSWTDEQNVYFSADIKPNISFLSSFQEKTIIFKYNTINKQWSMSSLQDVRINAAGTLYPDVSSQSNFDYFPITVIAGTLIKTPGTGARVGQWGTTFTNMSKPNSGQYSPMGDWSSININKSNEKTLAIKPIYCHGETQWLTFGAENVEKRISGLSLATENASGFKLYYQIDDQNMQASDSQNAVWTEIGDVTDKYITFFRNFKTEAFYRIKFKISGNTLGAQPVKIGEMRFLQITNLGYGEQ